MAISLLSPQVHVEEIDKSQYSVAASTSIGAAVIAANWGPVGVPQFIDNTNTMVNIFGEPNNANYKNWLCAANFLEYSSAMYITRMATVGQFTANANGVTGFKQQTITNADGEEIPVYDENGDPVQDQIGLKINSDADYFAQYDDGNASDYGEFAARCPGALGNSILVTYADSKSFDSWTYTDASGNEFDFRQEFSMAPGTSRYAAAHDSSNDEIHLLIVDIGGRITGTKGAILEKYEFLSKAVDGQDADGVANYYKRVLADQSNYVFCIDLPAEDAITPNYSEVVYGKFDSSAEIEEELAKFETPKAGVKFIDVEQQAIVVSVITPFITEEGLSTKKMVTRLYKSFDDVRNKKFLCQSDDSVIQIKFDQETEQYSVEAVDDQPFGKFGDEASDVEFGSMKQPYAVQLSGGADDNAYTDADEMQAWDSFMNKEQYDIGLCVTGAASPTVAKYVIEHVCEVRMDCVAFVSPCTADRGPILGNVTAADRVNGVSSAEVKILNKTLEYRTQSAFNVNSSYGHLDSGWKYQYDKFNDCNRWVPLNGDCAGLYARVDDTNNPWTVAAGYNRGQIKNVIKLSYSPSKEHRDLLYPKQINAVVTMRGEGTILYGSKTLQTRPSAFDRINVRRLFIYLEKTCANAAKYLLFELNNASTRSYALNIMDPILRQVSGLGGCYAFKIICDETNNPAEIIDQNRLIIDIFVQPTKVIDFINLRFVCQKTGESTFSISE